MDRIALDSYPLETIETLLSGIPFFKDLIVDDPQQLNVLLRHSNFFKPAPGEVVIHQGQRDNSYYFLLKGQLIVYPDDQHIGEKAVNYLSSGQIFGALAMLCETERTATIVADPQHQSTMLFGTSFEPFGELEDITRIRLNTKLAFYRMVAHNTRWKLELYRMDYPDHELVKQMRSIEIFHGKKNTMDELKSLDKQTRQLTDLLQRWNEALSDKRAKQEKLNDIEQLAIDTIHTA